MQDQPNQPTEKKDKEAGACCDTHATAATPATPRPARKMIPIMASGPMPSAPPASAEAGTQQQHIDPVCGMQVSVSPRSVMHAGQNYYFCCTSCQTKFAANPQGYLAASAKPQADSCCAAPAPIPAPAPETAPAPSSCCAKPAPAPVPAPAASSCCAKPAPAPAPAASSCCAAPSAEVDANAHIDPVCGMRVAVNPLHFEHAGREYYFCCQSCQSRFAADPVTWLQPRSKPAPPPGAADALYICPMCEGVEKIGPGDCWKCGMALEPKHGMAATDDTQLQAMLQRFYVAAAFTLPLFVLAMSDLWPALHHALQGWLGGRGMQWVQALLATPVVLWAAAPLNHRAWNSFVSGNLNMFSLIGVGMASAYLFSVFALLFPSSLPSAFLMHGAAPLYFEAAAVIITLVLLGQVLEMRAHGKTSAAIHSLLALAPSTALRLQSDGSEQEVAIAEVQVGDQLRVKPGARVAVDGKILQGNGVLDEAMLSGEAIPLAKEAGAKVWAGTVNQQGSFVMQAEKVGTSTLLAHIVEMVNQAARSRAPVQQLVDKVAGWFVPIVMAIAVLAFALWAWLGPQPSMAYGLMAAVTVLIIACPCALGLATPLSITVGVGRGAQAGVLIKQAQALQAMQQVDTLVLDKTGTLTMGHPELQQQLSAEHHPAEKLLQIAASLETWSEHPLALALVRAASKQQQAILEVHDFQQFAGRGVAGLVDGQRWYLGNAALLQEYGISTSPAALGSWQTSIETWRAAGQGVILLANAAGLQAAFAVADGIKPSAAAALASLRASGLHIVLASGDHASSVQAVAQQLGISDYHAGLLPQDKLKLIQTLQQQGRQVAMAGDGVNDAPALTQAQVGIAMGNGTEVAMHSAHLVLLGGDLQGIVRARRLAQAVLKNIRQNLWFAFGYNIIGVAIAAGALYPLFGILLNPMLASAAMSLSSLSVIANALRLRQQRLD